MHHNTIYRGYIASSGVAAMNLKWRRESEPNYHRASGTKQATRL